MLIWGALISHLVGVTANEWVLNELNYGLIAINYSEVYYCNMLFKVRWARSNCQQFEVKRCNFYLQLDKFGLVVNLVHLLQASARAGTNLQTCVPSLSYFFYSHPARGKLIPIRQIKRPQYPT